MARALVFLDASVLVAASRSPNGGSAIALQACQGVRFHAVVTERILTEARVNIAEKFGQTELVRFYQQLAALSPKVAGPPSDEHIHSCAQLTASKDVHVLAAALSSDAAYLLTLDRRHLLTPAILNAKPPFEVMTPGDFLRAITGE